MFVDVKVAVYVGVMVLVSVIVYVGVTVGVLPFNATKAQLTFPFESVTQFNLPTVVGVFVGDGMAHGALDIGYPAGVWSTGTPLL